MTTHSLPSSGINLAPKLMKGPLFYSKYYSLENTELFVTLKLSIPYNFIIALKKKKILHLKLAIECKFKRFTDYLETLQTIIQNWLLDLPELKNDVETGMYFDSSIPKDMV
jgi:mevalonate kinase